MFKKNLEIIIAILSLIFAIFTYISSNDKRDLIVYASPHASLIADSSQSAKSNIKITRHDGTELNGRIWSQQISVWNPGKLSLKKEHVLIPIDIGLNDKSIEILDYRITQEVRPKISQAKLTRLSKNKLQLSFKMLENKDAIYIQLAYLANKPAGLSLGGEIEGVNSISTELPTNWFPLSAIVFVLILASLFVLSYLALLQRDVVKDKPTLPLIRMSKNFVLRLLIGLACVGTGFTLSYVSLLAFDNFAVIQPPEPNE